MKVAYILFSHHCGTKDGGVSRRTLGQVPGVPYHLKKPQKQTNTATMSAVNFYTRKSNLNNLKKRFQIIETGMYLLIEHMQSLSFRRRRKQKHWSSSSCPLAVLLTMLPNMPSSTAHPWFFFKSQELETCFIL